MTAFDRAAAEDFLFHEAALMDAADWDAWLALFLPEASYWVPARVDQPDPIEEVSLIYDDLALLQARVAQLKHPQHYSNLPAVRASRHISNVRLASVSDSAAIVQSKLLMVEKAADLQRIYSGQATHDLRFVEGGIRIAAKKVVLLTCDAALEQMVLPL